MIAIARSLGIALACNVVALGVALADSPKENEVPKLPKPSGRTYPRAEFAGFGETFKGGKATGKTAAPTGKLVSPGVINQLADIGPTVSANLNAAWTAPLPLTCVDVTLLLNEGYCIDNTPTMTFCLNGRVKTFDCSLLGANSTCGYVSDVKSKVRLDCIVKPIKTLGEGVAANKPKAFKLIYPCSGAQQNQAMCANGERLYYCDGNSVYDYDCTIFEKDGKKAGCNMAGDVISCFFP